MSNSVMIEIQDETLDLVVGGSSSRGAASTSSRTLTLNNQRTNNSTINLNNMTVYGGTSGRNNIGGLAISVTQSNA